MALVAVLGTLIAACGGSAGADPTLGDTSPDTPAPTSPAPSTTSEETVDAPELGGTSWIVTTYALPSGSLTNVWKTDVTIAFAADGTFSGSSGCNEYQGTWTASGPYDEFTSGVPDANDGQELALNDLTWTERACDDEAIMEQEGEILDHLQNAGRWALIRDVFHLRDADGSFLFETEPA